ncbi:MAG: cell wall-binding repeat-containing protein [Lagierella massiliensis]|nr:cell wall-binding repeat-containing protein [Lagierella massiliensis]
MNRKLKKWISLFMVFSILFTTVFFQGLSSSKSFANDDVNISSMEGLKNKPIYVKDNRFGTLGEDTKVVFSNESGLKREFNSKYNEDTGLYYLELIFDVAGIWNLTHSNINGNIDEREFVINIFEDLYSMTGHSNGFVSIKSLEENPSINGDKLEELISTVIGYNSLGDYTEVLVKLSSPTSTSNFIVYNDGLSSSVSVEGDVNLAPGKYQVDVKVKGYSTSATLNLNSTYSNKKDIKVENITQEVENYSAENEAKLSEVSSTTSVLVQRHSGKNRYETAVEVSKSKFKSSHYVVLANGRDSEYILLGSSLAGALNAPILVTEKEKLNEASKKEIQRLNTKHVIILGDNSKVSSNVKETLSSMGKKVEVISSSNNADMSVKVATKLREFHSFDTVILTNENSLPDSLSASPLAANKKYPILYSNNSSISNVVKKYIGNSIVKKVIIVGGDQTVSNSIEKSLNSLGKSVSRVKGHSRYDTSLDVANKFFKNATSVGVASGQGFADSLISGPVSGLKSQPIILANNSISTGLSGFIKNGNIKTVNIYGGNDWVSDAFKVDLQNFLKKLYNSSNIQDATGSNKKIRVLLDPGHGEGRAHNRGYVGPKWKNEGDGNYYYSLILAKELRKYGIEVSTTRPNIKENPALATRGNLGVNHDLFISLHTNAANGSAKGVEIFEDVDHRATSLATALTNTISSTLGTSNRGVKYRYYGSNGYGVRPDSNYYGVLRNNKATAGMLIEHCFHDNMQDVLKYEGKPEILAKNMARDIAKYFGLI